jgi:pyruvate/oxaloacetate carboxyltransferase
VVSLVVSYPAVVDVVDVGFSSVSVGVSYPAVVDVVDLVVGVGVSVG